jgi:hypothetical protein
VIQIARAEDIDFSMMDRLLPTKHESWSYEQEVRVFVGLNDWSSGAAQRFTSWQKLSHRRVLE